MPSIPRHQHRHDPPPEAIPSGIQSDEPKTKATRRHLRTPTPIPAHCHGPSRTLSTPAAAVYHPKNRDQPYTNPTPDPPSVFANPLRDTTSQFRHCRRHRHRGFTAPRKRRHNTELQSTVTIEHVEQQNGMQAGGLLRGGDTFVETYWCVWKCVRHPVLELGRKMNSRHGRRRWCV